MSLPPTRAISAASAARAGSHALAAALVPAVLALLLTALPAGAAVRLPAILSDHMVLQRSATTPVWGWADAGETVTVRFGAAVAATRAGADGRWRVDLDVAGAGAGAAGGNELVVRGAAGEVVVRDVLVGDVWLASGQSNMQKPLGERKGERPTFNHRDEIAAAEAPGVRLFKVARGRAQRPADDVAGEWVRCSPESVKRTAFSAAAYFFGRRLHRELGVPVGLIDASVGGTRIELWTPSAALAASPGRAPAADDAVLYNAMVAGLAPFGLKGMLWYQGESNLIDDGDGAAYTAKMAALVGSWRGAFGNDLPFYYVQIAPHLYHVVRSAKVADAEAAARLRAAQAAALAIPGTGMVVTTDLADDLADIHPRDKRQVGLRLANLALAGTYGRKDIEAWGPRLRAMQVDGGRALLLFDHADGLFASDRKPLSWFQVAGADGRWHPARAEIERGRVAVHSDRVPQPAAVRFAWDEAAQPNLVNGAGLPAMPFSTAEPGTVLSDTSVAVPAHMPPAAPAAGTQAARFSEPAHH
ncbi:sialate O-acetylesterase [Massilia dura]|uniref:Sialate O-acetylesterase n=1 Tax=Pseudoduganella dura TaxID=321982 RepID=A0A6I3X8V7_9BURK|nr:sialate O-acetylesterase [Pseudoduganella dura]MUI11070.1 sialate O-acetylesterase [Pseudoduganella dura]GGY03207.1 9-O-acetylesterase [Pseudoduganella dura]